MRFSIVCAVNKPRVCLENLIKSKGIYYEHDLQLKMGYDSVSKAYNDAIPKCTENVIIFVHQDVFLPHDFFPELIISIGKLCYSDWGVLGVAGMQQNHLSANVLDRSYLLRTHEMKPQQVDTLDELILIIKKDTFNHIKFDEKIPHHHLFGTDICLQARTRGMKNFVIDAFCHHNSSLVTLPPCYNESENYIRNKWPNELPIYTTCSTIE